MFVGSTKAAQQIDLDCVQLNGEEDEAYMRAMWKPVIRQLRIKSDMSREELSDLVDHHLSLDRIVLLDRYDETSTRRDRKDFRLEHCRRDRGPRWSIASGRFDPE